ncbi:uncharacterized protein [Acropora muricata]|uniref:uncharacterized protein isoform X4 n=1 Tax=Acropora muricata TaxID=159855 RepID=UPI0034E3EC9C
MGLSELEELQHRYAALEKLYKGAVKDRDQAIEDRDKATVLIALQLESETQELNKEIETLQTENKKWREENEDLKIRLSYAKDDLNKLQQRHIQLQIEQEKCQKEKENTLGLLKEFEQKSEALQIDYVREEKEAVEEKNMDEKKDPAYSNVRNEIISASEKDLELEPGAPVTLKSSPLEDAYEVHDQIGKGKFGVVKKVTQRSSEKVYAAKYITPSSRSSGSSREDILHEISIMNQLHHKRLVGLIDAFDATGKIIMIMEFVSGGELFERVAAADCLTEKEASFYMYQLLQGLQYMHNKNIVHLDLKPENIVCVSKDNWDIKLIDFGLAQELEPGERMKALKGTPEFMAPEAVNFEVISLATDMWSVGVIAYILLSGLSPLLGDDDNETLTNVTAADWDFDDESFDVISDQAKDFISKLMVKNPRKRNTVAQCLQHDWMKGSASANAVKIDTKKLRQFLAKRRWQKSVNALVAVRRLSSLKPFTNVKSRPSVAPSLTTVPSEKEESCEGYTGDQITEECKNEQERKVDDQNDKHSQQNGESVVEAMPISEETEGVEENDEIDDLVVESVEEEEEEEVEMEEEDEEETEESEDEDVFVPKEFVEFRTDDIEKSYCIEEEVGRGRFGIVKKCVELDTATRFCAKFIKSRPSQKEEFKREISVMNSLHHSRLIRLYDAFEEPKQIILIMEYARGGDLSARMDGDSLPEFEAVKILKQVLEGIKFMHDSGFMHLDLKPQNVMFKNEGGSKIKLIDFTLTRKFDPDKETRISFGTAEYVAPEIVNYEPVTPSADMWAIGVMTYMMLSGESPFLGENEADTFRRITDGRWEFCDVFDYVSKGAKDFIMRLLMKEPRKRMAAEESLKHDWIKSPGFTGKRKSERFSESELFLEDSQPPLSPTETKRQESRRLDEEDEGLDPEKLVGKLKDLLAKLQHAEKENKFLEEKLRDEEEKADAVGDDLRMSEASRKELNEKVSKLVAENDSLSHQAKSNIDFRRKLADTEGEKKVLEDELMEKSKKLEILTQRCESLSEKMDHCDVLEEKVYCLERERKEYQEKMKDLEEERERLEKEKEGLVEMNEKASRNNRNLEDTILKLKDDGIKVDAQPNTWKNEKESLAEQFAKQIEELSEKNESLATEKSSLEKNLEALERENNYLNLRLNETYCELSKEREVNKYHEKDKNELEKQLDEIRMAKEESQKNCEELASKLSKVFAELEAAKVKVNDGTLDNQLEEIASLKESVRLLERDLDNLEDDLDEKEAENEDLKKKIEQLEAENMKTSSDLLTYKANVETTNEEILKLREKSSEQKKEKMNSDVKDEESSVEDHEKRVKDYESVIENLKKEVSSLQRSLVSETQKSKDLEEQVASVRQEGSRHVTVVDEEFIQLKENRVQSAVEDFTECPVLGMEQEIAEGKTSRKMEQDITSSKNGEKAIESKKDSEELKSFKEQFKSQLERERVRIRYLEEKVDNYEIEKRDGIEMYKELAAKCNQLREELNEQRSSRKEAEKTLQDKEQEINALNKKVELLKEEIQTISDEKDKGDILYDRLAEKHKNILKEKKILEEEKQQWEELEESMQTQIHDLMRAQEEMESMRKNLYFAVQEKDTTTKELTALQKDLIKQNSELQQLEERARDESHRADMLENERMSLRRQVEEMQKDFNRIELESSADKETINTYDNEIRTLKEENLKALSKTEALSKEKETLLQDSERLILEINDLNHLKLVNENASKNIEILQIENQGLHKRLVEFDQVKESCDNLRDELERVKDERRRLQIALQSEKDEVMNFTDSLRQEHVQLVQKVDEVDQLRQSLQKFEEEKVVREDQVKASAKERDEKISMLKENLRYVKIEKQDAMKQIKILRGENERLLKTVNESFKIGEDYDKLKVSFKRTSGVTEDRADLNIENKTTRKEIATLEEESNQVADKVPQYDEIQEELDKLRQEKEAGLDVIRKLQKENEDFVTETRKTKDLVSSLKNENEIASKEIEKLKEENKSLLKERDEFSSENKKFSSFSSEKIDLVNANAKMKEGSENFNDLRIDKDNLLREVERLKDENENLLQEFEQLNSRTFNLENEKKAFASEIEIFERMKKELSTLKEEKDRGVIEMENLKQEKNALLEKLEIMHGMKENLSPDLSVKRTLQEKGESLELQLEDQALETMKFKKETAKLKKTIDILRKDLQKLQDEKSHGDEEEEMVIARRTDEEKIDLLEKDLQRVFESDERFPLEECMEISSAKKVGDVSKQEASFIKTLKEEVGFLEKEVEDLSEENKELLQKYKGLQKEHNFSKEELKCIAKELEMTTNELQNITSQRDLLEKRKEELEQELQERMQELQELRKDYDPVKQRLDSAETEIKDLSTENEELHQNYVDLEEKYNRIRKINRELEEDVDIESNNFAGAKSRIEELNKMNLNLQQRVTKMQHEISKLRGISEGSEEEQRGDKSKTLVQSRREQLEAKLIEEELKSGKFGEESRRPPFHYRAQSMNNLYENQETISSLRREIKTLRSSKDQVETLEKKLQELTEKLNMETKNGIAKVEEIEAKKKENDSLIYELESTRHRLVSNVLSPLEEMTSLGAFRVTASDISAGKSKAWTSIKERIATLIREHDRLSGKNLHFQEESHASVRSLESDHLMAESNSGPQDKKESPRNPPTVEDILDKERELQALHKRVAQDAENLALVQNENKQLLRQIEIMKRMQFTTEQEKEAQREKTFLSSSLDRRLGQSVRSEFKVKKSQTVESISLVKSNVDQHSGSPELLNGNKTETGQEMGKTSWSGIEQDGDPTHEDEMQVARELVKKNKRIFELEQEVDQLLNKIEELSTGKISSRNQITHAEDYRQEILRLEGENKSLKEITNGAALVASTKKIETLEAMNTFLKSEKDELVLQIATKNKKIEILERRVEELTEMKTNVKNGVCSEADDHINEIDEELTKTKHKVTELEAELQHANLSYNSKLRRERDELEAKWTKRLRKECLDLQSELSENHNSEKLQWQKKEVELQNIIRQMKIVMNKKLGDAENERKKLTQELMSARRFTLRDGSNSEDSVRGPPSNPGARSTEKAQNDSGLSDRELRRVAYKLNGEEWSQLGTFLGVGDNDLLQLGGLSMGPQEKAFRLLCVWRTRCRLSRSQMISQLAVALEEVNRKDVAQFVLEQFMSGKPRKKLFGW